MKTTSILAAVLVGSVALSVAQQKTDCRPVARSMKMAVKDKEEAEVLKLIEKEISATPKCSCELMRSAIMGSKPKPQMVGRMVDTAISAAPDYMELIVMCALAAAPDAEAEILAVASKAGFVPNPLDSPGSIGENPAGQLLEARDTPLIVSPPRPPSATIVDP